MTNAAILLIDLLNTFEFVGGDQLKDAVAGMTAPLAALRRDAHVQDVPVIFVNDNYGRWHDEPSQLIDHAIDKGGETVAAIRPVPSDYFVIKPESSGFYATTLPALLPRLGVSRLILCGVASDICVLFTAADAHMREYDLWVPGDLVASHHGERGDWALDMMANGMSAEIRPTTDLTLAEWLASEPRVAPGTRGS
ncbi:cysteine hydrolase [Sphingomonas sp. NBWT7]|uniref:isochorismatase family cysteine hydrolase n=1 Tax=Sphingomonas sp. NBWT7 TaxID=2596913 RepID=UPI001627C387|nr:isochorismatase family cysteine hydrolase [Sphingomonas sp. NBWT7]QNE31749.1 cysteine hydrolase [Sphingomonas sp. NBWT7]